jgi:hypothetical protein
LSNANSNVLPGLTLRLEGDGAPEWGVRRVAEEACAPLEARQEGYSLSVPADGSGAVLSAVSTLGLFRGLNTFAQLWYYYRCAQAGGGGGGDYARGEGEDASPGAAVDACGDGSSSEMVYTLMAPVMIEDSPAYVRRGRDYCLRPVQSWTDLGNGDSHIAGSCSTPRETCMSSFFFAPRCADVLPYSRFSFPLPDIERTLDAMSWVHVRNRLICLSIFKACA